MTATLILVTFNRFNLLKETLNAYFSMTTRFDKMIIVDNHSTDGTEEFLKELAASHEELYVERLEKNIGGAGGFSRGVEIALQRGETDWIFVADDDAVPAPDMLEKLYMGYENAEDKDAIAAVCAGVINYGVYDLAHRRIIKRRCFSLKNVTRAADFERPFSVDEVSFVGLMVKSAVVKKIGLPNEKLFIYYDDTDYSYRIKREGEILCIPSAHIVHNARELSKKKADWRDYYAIRNELYYLKQYYPKRYFKAHKFRDYWKKVSFLAKLLRHRSKDERKLFKTAIQDAKRGVLGIHPVYRPQ